MANHLPAGNYFYPSLSGPKVYINATRTYTYHLTSGNTTPDHRQATYYPSGTMARGLAVVVLLLFIVAATAPFAYAGPEAALTARAATVAQAAGGGFSTGLPLYRETGNPKKDAANAAGASAVSGTLNAGLPLYQETGSGEKKA